MSTNNPNFLKKSPVSIQKPFYTKTSAVASGNQWERNVYHGISQYLHSGPEGYAHHVEMQKIHGRWSKPQIIDILVDNASGHNFGIECKSSQQTSLRLTTWFRHNGYDSQFENETEFLTRANRIGIVALVMREAGSPESSRRYGAYLIPWNVVSMIGSRVITTTVLDAFVADGLIYKLPTTNGTFKLPQDVDVFRRIAEMNEKAEDL